MSAAMSAMHPPELMTREQFEALAQLIRLKPGSQWDAVYSVMVNGMTQDEAADLAGTALVNVEHAVRSARQALELARLVAGY